MSKVALRVYNREIESLIDQGHVDEAVAHCQHILKTYPKHLETYRLLGKAQLELRRYADAADIFGRTLLAVPDDFVSHLGMSIVCDEQKDLDGAIWHMERAFEISSTNAGVQGELRRLRGRRDGMEPPKIQLTRGALAQIYTKGGEYQQAIPEIKAVLAEDENRSDMKTLLARAYFYAGMRNEAIETCIDLLKQYPYSLEGNRILVEILPGTSMAQGLEQYKRRVESLDPYVALATGSVFEVDSVPDTAVMIERMEWDPSSQPVASWNMPAVGTPNDEAAAPAAPAEDIPDWMKQSGWGESTGDFKDGPVNFNEPEPPAPAATGQLAAAEIPDWLKAMAPPGAVAAETPSEPAATASEEADFNWLAGLGAPASANEPASAEASALPSFGDESSDTDLDWLNNLGSEITPVSAADQSADSGLDWLKSLTPAEAGQPSQTSAETPIPTEEPLPDWLTAGDISQPSIPSVDLEAEPALGFEIPASVLPVVQPLDEQPSTASAPDLAELQTPQMEVPAQPEPVADWLKDLSGAGSNQPLSDLISGPGTSEAEQDESLKWLESLAEKQGAKAEELITNPSERVESVPDWINKVDATPQEPKDQPAAEFIPEKPIEVEAEPMSGELSPMSSGPGTTEAEQEDAFKWLEGLAAGQGAKAEELLTKPEERREQAPGWVGQVESPPTELSALISGPGTSSSEQDDALLWLESLAQKQGAKPEELITNPAERTENAPDWVGQVGQTPDVVKLPEPVQPASVEPAPEAEVPAPPTRKPDENYVSEPLSELVSGPGTTEAEQDAALLWLESLAQKQGAKAEELITNPADRVDSAPDWVAQVGQEPAVPVEVPPVEVGNDTMAWLKGLAEEEAPASAIPVSAANAELDWLNDLGKPAAETPASIPSEPSAQPVEAEPQPAVEGVPDWLSSLGQDDAGETVAPPEATAWETPAQPVEAEPQPAAEGVPDWLSSLGQDDAGENAAPPEATAWEAPAQPAEAEPQPAAEGVPDWLSNLGQADAGETAAPPEATAWEAPAQPAEAEPQPAAEGVPDWLSSLGQDDAGETVAPPEATAWEAPAQPAEAEPQPAVEGVPDWLSNLGQDDAGETAAPPEATAWETPAQPAEAEPQPAVEGVPDWLSSLGEDDAGETAAQPEATAWETPAQPAEAEPQPAVEGVPDWLSSLGQDDVGETAAPPEATAWETPAQPAETEQPHPIEESVPDWLSSLGQDDAGETAAPPEATAWETPAQPAEAEPQPAEESVPDWLSSLGQTDESAEALPWEQESPVEGLSTEPAGEMVSPEPQPTADISDWLNKLDLPEPAVSAATEASTGESEALPDWLKDASADEQAPEPESVLGWVAAEETIPQPPADEIVAATPVETPEPVAEANPTPPLAQRLALRQTGMLGGDKDAFAVQRARELLTRGGLEAAMGEYTKLIKRSKLLEDVIYDLQEAVYSHPVDVIVWQTLGDAYMRSNRLQDALDAYSKAEDLLR